MSNRFLTYLEREHARLERLIAEQMKQLRPDGCELARLKKQKLMVKDQIVQWGAEAFTEEAA